MDQVSFFIGAKTGPKTGPKVLIVPVVRMSPDTSIVPEFGVRHPPLWVTVAVKIEIGLGIFLRTCIVDLRAFVRRRENIAKGRD
jgi:hypothetical protein